MALSSLFFNFSFSLIASCRERFGSSAAAGVVSISELSCCAGVDGASCAGEDGASCAGEDGASR